MTPASATRILVTCGTGGVGKTTLSAAMAIRAAALGKKTLVITIDPAKRLATSLGLGPLGNEPQEVTDAVRNAWNGSSEPPQLLGSDSADFDPCGQLWALMPDSKRSFEEFVRLVAPDSPSAERILNNSLFQVFTQEFAGTNEYLALERLYALYKGGAYEWIILDTPPAQNTVDFLEAPELLRRFFSERLVRWLVLPANKILAAGMKKALGLLERLTGQGFMTQMLEFAQTLASVQDRFVRNLEQISLLLRAPQTSFVLVSSGDPKRAEQAKLFASLVEERGLNLKGVWINRSLSALQAASQGQGPSTVVAHLEPAVQEEFNQVVETLKEYAKSEVQLLQDPRASEIKILGVLPEFSRDIHCVEDLCHVAQKLSSLDPLLSESKPPAPNAS